MRSLPRLALNSGQSSRLSLPHAGIQKLSATTSLLVSTLLFLLVFSSFCLCLEIDPSRLQYDLRMPRYRPPIAWPLKDSWFSVGVRKARVNLVAEARSTLVSSQVDDSIKRKTDSEKNHTKPRQPIAKLEPNKTQKTSWALTITVSERNHVWNRKTVL